MPRFTIGPMGTDGNSIKRQRGRQGSAFAYAMRALGRDDLPAEVSIGGRTYRHVRTVKHDFFAATGFYDGADGERVVLKLGRTNAVFGLPGAFLGQWSRCRETRFHSQLADLPQVPQVLGRVGQTGFIHAFVKGRPLGGRGPNGKYLPVPDTFFDDLASLLREVHRRRIAYVDTNKPQNILLGDDGRPHLIDFQISYDLHELGDTWLNRQILARFQREDLYHLLKHKRRMRPDLLTRAEREAAARKSWVIRLHRFLFKPYFKIRRGAFRRLRASGQLLPEGSK